MKLPPYSKPLYELQLNFIQPSNDVYLFVGQGAWDKAKKSSIMRPTRTLCLPPDASPFTYHWPVAMCDILVIDTSPVDEILLQDLTAILFNCHAIIVRVISTDGELTVFKRN